VVRKASTGLFRAPLVHFAVGGAVLFRLVYGPAPFAAAARDSAPIVITADEVARLRGAYTRETGLEPTADDEAALVGKAVEEELLFREAVARGLDRNDRSVRNWLVEQMAVLSEDRADPDALYARARALGLDRTDAVVRRILIQKMRLLASRIDELPPSDDVLRAFYQEHVGDYVPPARISFWHVFVGAPASDRATALLASFRSDARAPADAVRAGDSFAVPAHLVAQSPERIAKLFGPEFAARLAGAETRQWIGPVPSAYGSHLVWIEAREPATPPAFDSVRERVRERWQDDQRRKRVQDLLRDLEERYPLRIESAAWRQRSAS
jgi:peptidyl-prolyl cis-trans isomerase C